MKKKALRILAWITGTFALCLVAFVVVLYVNREQVINRVVSEANEILTEPVDIASINISIDRFPLASIRLNEVFCKGHNSMPHDTLIYAEQVYLEFHLWKLVTGDWSIQGLTIDDGKLAIRFPESGEPNYKIWQGQKDGSSSAVFNLEHIQLQNMDLKVEVEKQAVNLSAAIHQAHLSGKFSSEDYQLRADADFLLKELLYRERVLLSPENLLAKLDIQGKGQNIALENGEMEVSGFKLRFNGNYDPEKFLLEASGNNLDIAELNDFYQKQNWTEQPLKANLAGSGDFQFSGTFPNNQTESQYEVGFNISDGIISDKSVKLSSIKITGSYNHGPLSDRIDLTSFNGSGRTGEISGSLSILDLESPAVNLKLISDLELKEWLLILPLDTLSEAEGRLAVNVNLSNHFKSLKQVTAAELRKTQARGQVELRKVGFGFRKSDKTIENLNASLSFGKDQLDIDNFYFETGQSDVFLSGHFSNVLGYLFFKKEKLKMDTKVRSQELHVEDFLFTGKSGNGEYSLDFARSIEMQLALEVDQFFFDSFYAEQVQGDLSILNDMIRVNKLAFEADEGVFNGNFSINMKEVNSYRLMANLNATNADLHELFVSFNNFGQSELVADNIYGRANMKLQMTSSLEPNLYLPPESVYLKADLDIKDGTLKNYHPMMALSDYADIAELAEVKFSQLSNQISIEESVIHIPEMLIHSNVLDLQLSGEHHFDNSIDYSMRLKLADVIFRKRKQSNKTSEFDDHLTEMENSDDPNIYISMSGTTSYPIITLDKERMNKTIKEDFKKQGTELKQIFTKKDPPATKTKSSGIEYSLFDEDEDDGEN